MMGRIKSFFARLLRAETGVAMVEFAYSLPIVVPLFLGGAELTNYAIIKMRVSQLALHVADNGSRIGTDMVLSNPRISEMQINDLLIGADLQSGTLDLAGRGRVILSSVEPMANPNSTDRYRIRWQRCHGAKVWPSSYGVQGATDLVGVGPADRQVTVPDNNGIMFVEIAYTYNALVSSMFVPATNIRATAAMVVRDARDYTGNGGTGVYNTEGATPSSCA